MREYQAKYKIARILYSKITIIVVIILILVLGKALWNIWWKEHDSAQRAEKSRQELEKIKEREAVLNTQIENLKTNAGIESEARAKWSVVKPGEKVIVIVDDEATSAKKEEKNSWWDNFLEIFR